MSEYAVRVETMPNFNDVDATVTLREALEAEERICDVETELDVVKGSLIANFRIKERTQGRALEIGVETFYDGLAGAGYDTQKPGWRLFVEIEVASDAG